MKNHVQNIIVHKEPQVSEHSHGLNLEEINTLKIMTNINRTFSKQLEATPA